jgi:hypothetical protein
MNIARTNYGLASGNILIVVLLVVGAVVFFSPRLQDRALSLWQNHFTWSPGEIQKDPVGYTEHGIRQAESTAIRAREVYIAAAQASIRNTRLLAKVEQDRDAAARLFNMFADSYEQALAGDAWPFEYNGHAYDQDALQRLIVQLHERHETLNAEARRRTSAEAVYRTNMREAERARRDAEAQQGKLAEVLQQMQIRGADLSIAELQDVEALIGKLTGIGGLDAPPSADALIEAEAQAEPIPFDELLRKRL